MAPRPACQACHQAKTKCVGSVPTCERCTNFELECVPHLSRQGQGKRRRRKHDTEGDDGLEASEDASVLDQLGVKQQNHFGIRYLIQSWLSFAVRRRSFSLLSRASKLAAQMHIKMDDIFCSMDFLPSVVGTPQAQQHLCPSAPLSWDNIPETLLQATACTESDGSRENRWIWIREMDRGMSRYLLSQAFANDVATLSVVTETWKRNEIAVVDLFLETKHKHTQLFAHQISLQTTADTEPTCCRASNIMLKTLTQGTVQVDQIACLCIVDANRSFYFLEYVPNTIEDSKREQQATGSRLRSDEILLDDILGTSDDADLQLFLALMEQYDEDSSL